MPYTKRNELGLVEGGRDLTTGHRRQTLNACDNNQMRI